jgi:hypothetical protein
LVIFVKAWSWFIATSCSRKTLANILAQPNSKKIIYKRKNMKDILTFLIIIFCFVSCENTDDGTSSSLPNFTTEGKNTFGCKIDNQIFLPKRKITGSPYSNPILKATYVYNEYYFNGYYLSIFANNEVSNKLINIRLNGGLNPLIEGNTYPINVNQDNNIYGIYEHWGKTIDNGDGTGFTPVYEFTTNNSNFGELKIIKLDTENKIISGVFWFDCKEINRDTISHITEGRFDLKYTIDF